MREGVGFRGDEVEVVEGVGCRVVVLIEVAREVARRIEAELDERGVGLGDPDEAIELVVVVDREVSE